MFAAALDPRLSDTVSIEKEELSKGSTIRKALDQYIQVKSKRGWSSSGTLRA